MSKKPEIIIALLWFKVVFGTLGLVWYFPNLETIGLYILGAAIVFAFYFGYFHEKIGLKWGIPLTLLTISLSFLGLYLIEQIPFLRELLGANSIVARYSVANIVITLIIAGILRLIGLLRE